MTIRAVVCLAATLLVACAAASGPEFGLAPDGAPEDAAPAEGEPAERHDVADAGPTIREAAPADVAAPERREASVDAAPAPREAEAPHVDAAASPPLDAGPAPVDAGAPPVEAAPPPPPIDVRCATEAGTLFECLVQADGGLVVHPGSNASIQAFPPGAPPLTCAAGMPPSGPCAPGTACTGFLAQAGTASPYAGTCQ